MAASGISVVDDRAGITFGVDTVCSVGCSGGGGGCFVGWCCAVT